MTDTPTGGVRLLLLAGIGVSLGGTAASVAWRGYGFAPIFLLCFAWFIYARRHFQSEPGKGAE